MLLVLGHDFLEKNDREYWLSSLFSFSWFFKYLAAFLDKDALRWLQEINLLAVGSFRYYFLNEFRTNFLLFWRSTRKFCTALWKNEICWLTKSLKFLIFLLSDQQLSYSFGFLKFSPSFLFSRLQSLKIPFSLLPFFYLSCNADIFPIRFCISILLKSLVPAVSESLAIVHFASQFSQNWIWSNKLMWGLSSSWLLSYK